VLSRHQFEVCRRLTGTDHPHRQGLLVQRKAPEVEMDREGPLEALPILDISLRVHVGDLGQHPVHVSLIEYQQGRVPDGGQR
jgi:hypothetical protein